MMRSRVTLAMMEAAATEADRRSPSTRFRCGHRSPGTVTKSVNTSSGSTPSAPSACPIASRVACRMLIRSIVR